MRLLITADLHFNHRVSKAPAELVIADMNRAGGDAILVVGDTGVADGQSIEECLSLFESDKPKLFIAGNHELWSLRDDSRPIFETELPRRVSDLGWTWLQREPIRFGDTAIIGNIGWYDYSFAEASLGISDSQYEQGRSPDSSARWNDAKFVKLHQTNESFLDAQLRLLRAQLEASREAKRVIVAVHHVPFRELLPPRHNAQWDFVRAYLGSQKIGETISAFPNVDTVVCGHSHVPMEAQIDSIRAINIGCGYRHKHFLHLDIAD